MSPNDRNLVIDGHEINDSSECWVIAEIGHNHQGSVERAKELFQEGEHSRFWDTDYAAPFSNGLHKAVADATIFDPPGT